MIVFSRELYVCRHSPCGNFDAYAQPNQQLSFRAGNAADIARLPDEWRTPARAREYHERLQAGDRWLIGEFDGRLATFVWVHCREQFDYPHLPGCSFTLRGDAVYGYDAFTLPEFRGRGFRRSCHRAELELAGSLGRPHEIGIVIAAHLQGAARSFAAAGALLQPLWRVTLRCRTLVYEQLTDDPGVWPICATQNSAIALRS